MQRACSCGAPDRAPAAVAYQLPRVAGSMACSALLQNTVTRESRTGPYRQHCSHYVHQPSRRSTLMLQLTRHLLLWSQMHLRLLRAIHIPGELSRAADGLSHQPALPEEWRLHTEVVQLIWRRFHSQLFYSLSEGTLGTDALAHSWPWGLRKNMRFPH